MRALRWIVINGIFAAAIYYGLYDGISGAENVAYFMAWMAIVTSPVACAGAMIKEMRKKGRSVPAWLDVLFDMSVALAFVWAGAIVTGVFYVIHLCLQQYGWQEAEKEPPEVKNEHTAKPQ